MKNNGPKRFDEEIMPIVNETCPHIEVYVLTSGQHPNLVNVNLEGININKDEFEILVMRYKITRYGGALFLLKSIKLINLICLISSTLTFSLASVRSLMYSVHTGFSVNSSTVLV